MPTASPRLAIQGYEVLGTLGQGARSTIFSVRDKDGQVFALKRVVRLTSADQRFLEQAMLEYDVARRFTHPNLRAVYRLAKVRKFLRLREVLVLMEYVDGDTLERHKPKTMIGLCEIARSVAIALHEMHEGGFVHCDIKPNNVIMTRKGRIKIIDFGQSCRIGTVKQRIQGTPDYIAPEQVMRRQLTPATDVFNLGATLYWMLTRQHVPTMLPRDVRPGAGLSLPSPERCVAPREINDTVPPAMSSLVMHCVATDPLDRPRNMLELHDRITLAMDQIKREQSGTSEPQKPASSTAGDTSIDHDSFPDPFPG